MNINQRGASNRSPFLITLGNSPRIHDIIVSMLNGVLKRFFSSAPKHFRQTNGNTTATLALTRRDFLRSASSVATATALAGLSSGCSNNSNNNQELKKEIQKINDKISSNKITEDFFLKTISEIIALIKKMIPDKNTNGDPNIITDTEIDFLQAENKSEYTKPLFEALFQLIQKFCREPFTRAKTEDQKNAALKDLANRANIVSSVIGRTFEKYPNPIQSSFGKVFEVFDEVGKKFFPGEDLNKKMIKLGYLPNFLAMKVLAGGITPLAMKERGSIKSESGFKFFIPIGENNRKTLDLSSFLEKYPDLVKFFQSIDPEFKKEQTIEYLEIDSEHSSEHQGYCNPLLGIIVVSPETTDKFIKSIGSSALRETLKDSILANELFHFLFHGKVSAELEEFGSDVSSAMVSVPALLRLNRPSGQKIQEDLPAPPGYIYAKNQLNYALIDTLSKHLKPRGKDPENFFKSMSLMFTRHANLDREATKDEMLQRGGSLELVFKEYDINPATFETDFKANFVKRFLSPEANP